MFAKIRALLRNLFRRSRVERELDDELRFHLDAQVEANVRAGMAPAEARRQAQLELGRVEQVKEELRAMRPGVWLETLWQDVRFGARMLRRNPGFALVAVLTLALGIGANTAIFSVVNAVLVRPLPVRDVERLAMVVTMQGPDPVSVSAIDLEEWTKSVRSFESLAAGSIQSHNLTGDAEPERVNTTAIDANFFSTFGVAPLLGRSFSPEETRGAVTAPVVILGHGLWQRRYGGDPSILDRTIRLDGRDHAVVGVMPAGFDFPLQTQLWTPFSLDSVPANARSVRTHVAIARLQPGVPFPQAEQELQTLARRLETERPTTHAGWGAKLMPIRLVLLDDFQGQVRAGLLAVLAAVAFLLLIACSNLANLLLGRSLGRGQEIAVRMALGAGGSRLVRQLLTEAALLAAAGGLAGVLLAVWATPLLLRLSPIRASAFSSHLLNVAFDGRVLLFALAVTGATGALFALAPALRVARADLAGYLKEKTARGSLSTGTRRLMDVSVVAQVALTLVLLTAAGIMIRSFGRLQRLEMGFRPANTMTMEINLPPGQYPDYAQRGIFVEQLLERVRRLPGVEAAGVTTNTPLSHNAWDAAFECEGRPRAGASEVLLTADRLVSPGYLETIGVTLLRGRTLSPQDTAGAQPVAVITESLASTCWPGQDPIGKRVRRTSPVLPNHWMTVVGLARDVREDRNAFRRGRPAWYLPFVQTASARPIHLVVRAEGDPLALANDIRREVWALDANQPISAPLPLDASVTELVHPDRFAAFVMVFLALVGMLLATIGIFGLVSYVTGQRTREIGIRMAFGAQRADILKMVLRQGLGLVLAGVALGGAAAAAVSKLLASFVFDPQRGDLFTIAGVALVLAAVALAACWIPARRATRVDPIVALRYE